MGPPRARGRTAVLLALSSMVVCLLVSMAASASAQAGTVTRSYTSEGTEGTFVVPAGVESIDVVAVGGNGGSTFESEGGSGARVEGTLGVTPGSTLYVEVGSEGQLRSAGTGGRSSDIRTAPRSHGLSPDDRLLVAGGGGGAGEEARGGGEGEVSQGGAGGSAGGAGGEEGGDGIFARGGKGGTQSSGGNGGTSEIEEHECTRGPEAENGAREVGGAGADCTATGISGGGGGWGYFGGGGGAAVFSGGGGGGGSSLVPAGGSVILFEYEDPEVLISYTQPPNPPAVVTAGASEVRRETASANATVNPEDEEVSSCELEYGTSEAYGASVACSPSPGAGIAPVAVSAQLSGLSPETTYHYRVAASNANGTSYGSDETFHTLTHEPPTVTGISPEAGPQAGGETVTITGTELAEASAVTFGSTAAKSFTVKSNESITAVSPAGTGTASVSVTTPSGTGQSASHFTFLAQPVVTRISPGDGPAAGGTSVAITGSGFTAGSGVSFGASAASTVTVNSATSITAVAPPGSDTVDVTVAVPDAGTSAASPNDRFGYESGAPEYGRCVAAPLVKASPVGGFTDNKCENASLTTTGKYAWEPGAERGGFTATSSGAATLETAAKAKVACTSAAITGQIASSTGVSGETIRFKGCAAAADACTTSGLGAGEIETAVLQGVLGWEKKAKNKAVLVLSATTGPFMQYTCAGSPATTVTGSLLVAVKAGKMESSSKLKLSGKKGKQKPEALEGGERHVLSSSVGGAPPEQIGLTLSGTQINEEAVEINPVV